jgi:hypothetical protein
VKRNYGNGSITERGEGSGIFRLRYMADGQRFSVTFRGTKTDAGKELRRLLKSGDDDEHVAPDKKTVAQLLHERLAQWETAPDGIGPKTAERYRELINNQIIPHLGTKRVQKLKPAHIETWHTTLATRGIRAGQPASAW